MLAHGLSIALLFMLCGQIEKQTGTLEINSLGGLGTRLPRMAFVFGLAGMASIASPAWRTSRASSWSSSPVSPGSRTASAPWQIATILCLWGLVIGAVYMLRAYRNIFQGDLSKGRRLRDGNCCPPNARPTTSWSSPWSSSASCRTWFSNSSPDHPLNTIQA